MLQVCYLGSLLLSLLTGSLSVTLVSIYHRTEAVLIIIACSCFLHSLCQLTTLVFNWLRYSVWWQSLFLFLELITLGSSIEFYHYSIRNMIPRREVLYQHIMLAFDSSLLFQLFVNGVFLGVWICSLSSQVPSDDDENIISSNNIQDQEPKYEDVPYVDNNKFVPMKDSAQTLTPQMYNIQFAHNNNNFGNTANILLQNEKHTTKDNNNLNWMTLNGRIPSKTSEEDSNASVIRHQLGSNSRNQSIKRNNLNQKLRSFSASSFGSKNSTSSPSQSPLKSLQGFRFKSPKKFPFRQNKIQKENEIVQLRKNQEKSSIGLNTKYLTRLSTISDLHKSFINLLGASQSEDGILDNNNNNTHSSISNFKNNNNNNIDNIIKNSNNHNQSPNAYHHHSSFIELSGQVLDDGQVKNLSPKLTQERKAIERINNALLPPCLQTEVSNVESMATDGRCNDVLKNRDALSVLIPDPPIEKEILSQETILNDLRDISQIPNLGFGTDKDFTSPITTKENFEYPPKISLDMWEKNKIEFMRKASEHSQNSTLMSPFQFNLNPSQMQSISESPVLESKQHFSFPQKSTLEEEIEIANVEDDDKQDDLVESYVETKDNKIDHERNISDTISELDKYLNDYEVSSRDQSQLLEESLQQEDTSMTNMITSTSGKLSREFTRTNTRHSPTKSIISIISGAGTNNGGAAIGIGGVGIHRQRSQNFSFSTPTHGRTNSQIQYTFPQNVNISTQSSPTKQRFKRIGKKLSLSNISDNMFSDTDSKYDHSRNQSVEFPYIHELQNKGHSPSKSISVIPQGHKPSLCVSSNGLKINTNSGPSVIESPNKRGNRRHSMATVEKVFRSASSMFYKQSNVTIEMNTDEVQHDTYIFTPPPMENLVEERKTSNQVSMGSENSYPEMVMSEYDREKWNTMKNLDMIDDEGHLKK